MKAKLPFWQRLALTIVVMLAASFVAGLISENLFGLALPSYVGGLVGGLSAVPVWDLLKRVRPSAQ